MGLDTSHDCWHGPYSQFMRWRCYLHWAITGEPGDTRDALEAAWESGRYDDQSVPINVLMRHSDCDGSIPADVCGPLADALQRLVDDRMPKRGIYDEKRPATERFISGLRRAAAAGECVEFG
jgi:hypothetical protein